MASVLFNMRSSTTKIIKSNFSSLHKNNVCCKMQCQEPGTDDNQFHFIQCQVLQKQLNRKQVTQKKYVKYNVVALMMSRLLQFREDILEKESLPMGKPNIFHMLPSSSMELLWRLCYFIQSIEIVVACLDDKHSQVLFSVLPLPKLCISKISLERLGPIQSFICKAIFKNSPGQPTLMLETFLKLGKLQCKSNFNRNQVLLLNKDNFEPNQIVLYLRGGYMMQLETTCHVSHVTCHVSCVVCHFSTIPKP